jgi:hypothetical protein
LALIAGAVAIAFIGNCARAFFLVWVAETKNIAAVDQWHDIAGYSIVAAVFVGSLLLATALRRKKTEIQPPPDLRRGTLNLKFLPAWCLILAFFWLGFIEIASEAWYRLHERNLAPAMPWTVRWPSDAPGFREIKIDQTVRNTLRYDDGHEAIWNTRLPASKTVGAGEQTAAATCTLFVFHWKPGGTSVIRARAHQPELCLPRAGWRKISDRGVAQYSVERGFSVPFRHVAFVHRRSGAVAHTFFCLQEDELRPTDPQPNEPVSKVAHPKQKSNIRERFRVVSDGVRNLGQQVMELVFVSSPEVADSAAEKKFIELIPTLIQVQEQKSQ